MITSEKNPKIQRARALIERSKERKKQAAFVVEGVRLMEEVLLSEWKTELILISDNLSSRGFNPGRSISKSRIHCRRNSTNRDAKFSRYGNTARYPCHHKPAPSPNP